MMRFTIDTWCGPRSVKTLADVDATAEINFTVAALKNEPAMAYLVTRIVGMSSLLDSELKMLAVHVLGANAVPTLALIDAIQSEHIRKAGLLAAARTLYGPEVCALFEAVIETALDAKKGRHCLAHWIWATSPQVPRCLLLADPQYVHESNTFYSRMLQHEEEFKKAMDEIGHEGILKRVVPDASRILVLSEADLEDVLDELLQAYQALQMLQAYLRPTAPNALTPDAPMTKEEALRHLLEFTQVAGRYAKKVAKLAAS